MLLSFLQKVPVIKYLVTSMFGISGIWNLSLDTLISLLLGQQGPDLIFSVQTLRLSVR